MIYDDICDVCKKISVLHCCGTMENKLHTFCTNGITIQVDDMCKNLCILLSSSDSHTDGS